MNRALDTRNFAPSFLEKVEAGCFRLLHRNPPATRLGSSAFWLFVITVVFFALAWIPGDVGDIFASLATLTLLASLFSTVPLFLRWLRWRMLWKLRNRLWVTYLLIGLAPVVLFGTLAAIASYVLSGQFANFAATAEINTQLTDLSARNQEFAFQIAHLVADHSGNPSKLQLSNIHFSAGDIPQTGALFQRAAFLDGQQLSLPWLPESMRMDESQLPPWVKAPFRDLVVDNGQISFRVVDSVTVGSHAIVTMRSMPLNAAFLGRLASGLGRITLLPMSRLNVGDVSNRLVANSNQAANLENHTDSFLWKQSEAELKADTETVQTISGGVLVKRDNLLDIPIEIPTLLNTTSWRTGKRFAMVALVTSRPSLLYQRLFSESIVMGTALRIALLLAALVFGVLQLLALWMASRLSSTVTQSISELHRATSAVDEGKLDYRIQITRNDQLADLGRSFNSMSASLEKLLAEQHEKERMQNELAIAQEVQENLFPSTSIVLPKLELYGFCRPARAVSGDYYDFLRIGEASLGIALGDISGKGISAALLMATLHSAVRAYRFCSEDLLASQSGTLDVSDDIFQSPGKILSLLNRHLYLSTQPEKYATLFLAHYDAQDRRLRYSNGGHLPPLVLRANGTVTRLDRGGTVVGLLEGVSYEEGRVHLEPGDLLVGYTDGVTEPENEFGEFGETRMMEVIRAHRHLPLQEICNRLLLALDEWIGTAEQPDDITLVLARQQ
ncbi:MAG TPA: SpoIIE family protein phosphatase [Acidobacteriaceae bacterium]|nr:SpoIIE family protein phosphatase [Acidobacteriaceae bacterium]